MSLQPIKFTVTCKIDEDPSKNEDTRVLSTFLPLYVCGDFSIHSRAVNSAVPGGILLDYNDSNVAS